MQVLLLPPRRAGGPGYLQTAQPYLDPWEDDGANFPVEAISKHKTDMKMISNSYCSFKKGKSCLISLAALCDKMTGLVEEKREFCTV